MIITESDVLTLSEEHSDYNGYGVECYGDENGFINIEVTGGANENYTYNWSNGDTIQNLENIGADVYTLVVTDANLCQDSVTVTITEPEFGLDLEGEVFSYQGDFGVSCFGESDGSIELNPIGGTTPYSYLWSNGDTSQNLDDLEAGEYSVVVTDANLCQDSLTFTVSSPDLLVIAETHSDYQTWGVGCKNY